MCPAIVIFLPLKLPIFSALLCTVLFSLFNSPFTAAFASTPGTWQHKAKQGSRDAHAVNELFPLHPIGWRCQLWMEDMLAAVRAVFISRCLTSLLSHASICHDPVAKSSTVQQHEYSYRITDWKCAQVKIPASGSSELWKEVLAQDQELIIKVFFPSVYVFSPHWHPKVLQQ